MRKRNHRFRAHLRKSRKLRAAQRERSGVSSELLAYLAKHPEPGCCARHVA